MTLIDWLSPVDDDDDEDEDGMRDCLRCKRLIYLCLYDCVYIIVYIIVYALDIDCQWVISPLDRS